VRAGTGESAQWRLGSEALDSQQGGRAYEQMRADEATMAENAQWRGSVAGQAILRQCWIECAMRRVDPQTGKQTGKQRSATAVAWITRAEMAAEWAQMTAEIRGRAAMREDRQRMRAEMADVLAAQMAAMQEEEQRMRAETAAEWAEMTAERAAMREWEEEQHMQAEMTDDLAAMQEEEQRMQEAERAAERAAMRGEGQRIARGAARGAMQAAAAAAAGQQQTSGTHAIFADEARVAGLEEVEEVVT
jgi:hypothetical protein